LTRSLNSIPTSSKRSRHRGDRAGRRNGRGRLQTMNARSKTFLTIGPPEQHGEHIICDGPTQRAWSVSKNFELESNYWPAQYNIAIAHYMMGRYTDAVRSPESGLEPWISRCEVPHGCLAHPDRQSQRS
jgi:hypothetical protein